jgi:hypothetical protein
MLSKFKMEILDSYLLPIPQSKRVFFIKPKLYIFLIGFITAFNLLLGYLITFNSDASIQKIVALLSSFVIVYVFAPFASVILAVVFAMLPYKGQLYSQKYLPVASLIYLILNIALLMLYLVAFYGINEPLRY